MTSKMPKKNTTKTSSVPEQVASSTPVETAVEKIVRKPKSTASSVVESSSVVPLVESSSVVPVVETSSVVEKVAVEQTEAEVTLSEQSVDFLTKLQQLGSLITSLKSEYKTLEKKWSRELKASQKLCSKRKRKAGNRAPSGFVKPTKISDELASFLGKDKGTEMARTDVTREINTYIRAHKLQDKDNGRKINPDPKLATLLKLKKTDELTYFNLQKYMSPHFAKSVKAAETVVDVVA